MFLTTANKIMWKKMAVAGASALAMVLLGIFWFDKPLFLFMRNFDWDIWRAFEFVFDGWNWIILSTVAVLTIYVKKSLKTKGCIWENIKRFKIAAILHDFLEKTKSSYAFFIFCSVFGAGFVAKVLKTFIGRARPIFYEALDMTGFFPPSTEWAFNSMPSGHTAVSFAGLVMIGLLAPKYKWLTWTLAIIIGVSRVCTGAHWPTDILLAAFIGMVIADLAKSAICSRI